MEPKLVRAVCASGGAHSEKIKLHNVLAVVVCNYAPTRMV
jgi:hypothetical protein